MDGVGLGLGLGLAPELALGLALGLGDDVSPLWSSTSVAAFKVSARIEAGSGR